MQNFVAIIDEELEGRAPLRARPGRMAIVSSEFSEPQ
jgi:hypothetical protein